MLAIRDWSVRRRLVLAFLVILISNLALIVGAGVWARAIWQHVLAVRHAVTMEAQAASEIRLALPRVTSSVERHLMTREGSDHEQLERNLVRLREALARRNALFRAHPEEGERELLEAVEDQVSRIEALGRELLAVHHRRASGVSSATLDELHRLSDEAAAALAKLQQANLREVEAEIEEGSIVFRWVMTAGLAMLALNMAGGAAVVLLFSSRLNRPILAIARGSRRIAGGDLAHRAAADAGGEPGETARAVTEMTERLEASHGALARRNEGLAAINAVAAAVSGSLELQEVLPRVLDIVMAAIGMEAGAVRVLDESSNTLVLTASRGLSRRYRIDGVLREVLSLPPAAGRLRAVRDQRSDPRHDHGAAGRLRHSGRRHRRRHEDDVPGRPREGAPRRDDRRRSAQGGRISRGGAGRRGAW